MRITSTATLPVRDETVPRRSALLHAERLRRGTRQGRRALTCYRQAVLILRRLLDAGLGYEGEAGTGTVAFKTPEHGRLSDLQQQCNRAHNRLRAVGERGNSLLKVTFKAQRNVTLCP